MRWLLSLIVLFFLAAAAWFIASILSPDAIAMAVGLLFGVLATIPVAMLVMASNRHDYNDDYGGLPAPRETPAPVVVIYSNRTTNNTVLMTPEEFEKEECWDGPPPRLAQLTGPTRR